MPFGKTISLFLIDGDPNKRWVCELSNWNGKAYKLPRISVKNCDDREDLSACGVYFLFGWDDSDKKGIVYIGEAEDVLSRLKQHDAPNGKDFWNECIVFISNRLNKAHIKYLERRCYLLAKAAGRYTVENSTVPADASLNEREQAEMDEFLYNLRMISNVLGHKVLEPLIDHVKTNAAEEKSELLAISTARGACAKGMMTGDGFVVLKGSRIAESETKSCKKHVSALRKKLMQEGKIQDWVFTEDYVFSSPSAAAGVVEGMSANGLTEWKKKSD